MRKMRLDSVLNSNVSLGYYDSVVVVYVIVASPVTTYTSHSLPKKYVMVRYFDGSFFPTPLLSLICLE